MMQQATDAAGTAKHAVDPAAPATEPEPSEDSTDVEGPKATPALVLVPQRLDVFELRVHGVSGTSPESLLARPLVTQVAGDGIAGFYRPRLSEEWFDDRPRPEQPEQVNAPRLEGYNWAGLTSGSPGRALWLLLLPFTLVNIAPRARPVVPDQASGSGLLGWLCRLVSLGSGWVIWYACRLLALCLTLLLVLTTAGISIDLVWWQCRHDTDGCAGLPGPVNSMLHWDPGTTLLLAATFPALLMIALWAVSHNTVGRYEEIQEPAEAGYDSEATKAEVPLESRWMWDNTEPVRRLRALHFQAGTAAIMWAVTAAADDEVAFSKSWTWVAAVGLPAMVLAYAVVMLAVPSVSSRTPWAPALKPAIWGLLTVGVIVQVLRFFGDKQVGEAITQAKSRAGSVRLYEDTTVWLLSVTAVATVVLAVFVICAAREQHGTLTATGHAELKAGVGGVASALLAILGVLFAAALSAAVYSYAGTWLTSGLGRPGPGAVSHALEAFTLPDTFRAAAAAIFYSFFVLLAVVLVSGMVVLVRCGVLPLTSVEVRPPSAFASDYGAAADTDTDPQTVRRRKSVQRAMYVGTLVETIPVVAAWLAVAGAVISVALGLVVISATEGVSLSFAEKGVNSLRSDEQGLSDFALVFGPTVQGWGAFIALWSLIGVVAVAAIAFRVPATRRTVGILWDVASFWPRVVHPLAAPCYAERAVPDLVNRLRWHVLAGRKVVLAGHSQGSILSAAALFRIARGTGHECDSIALLTFGCVLRRLYGRMFPVYFRPEKLADLEAVVTKGEERRWLNLWRYTDYLGGQVTAGPPQEVPDEEAAVVDPDTLLASPPVEGPGWEWHSPDPPVFDRRPGDTAYLKPSRHSDYWSDLSGVFQLAVVQLVGMLEG